MKTINGYIVVLCLLCSIIELKAQELKDTTKLKVFEIKSKLSAPTILLPLISRDTTFVNNERNENLSQILNRQSGVFVKEYSPGGLVSISHRGYSTSQTLFFWNGFPVQSLTLGQADPNFLRPHSSNEIRWLGGSFSLLETSGGLASVMLMDDKAPSNREASIYMSASTIANESFNFYCQERLKNFSFFVNAYSAMGKNNYAFTNNAFSSNANDGIVEQRVNADFQSKDVKAGFFLKLKKSDYRAHFWYGKSFSQLPASLLSVQSEDNAEQITQTFKTVLNYSTVLGQFSQINGSVFFSTDQFNYSSEQPIERSNNKSQSFSSKWQWSHKIRFWDLSIYDFYSYSSVESNQFQKRKTSNQHEIQGKISRQTTKSTFFTTLFLMGRESFSPSLSLGMGYWVTLDTLSHFIIQLGFGSSRNQRYPSFNDLYWYPGGNPDLLPEINTSFDLWNKISFAKGQISGSLNLTPYLSIGQNFIRWIPDSVGVLWHSENIRNTKQFGVDVQLAFQIRKKQSYFRLTASGSWVNAMDTETKPYKKLMYVPQWKFTSKPEFRWKNWEFFYLFSYIGKRYSTANNDRFMPYIYLHDVGVQFRMERKKLSLFPGITVNNIANANYQYIAWYPMPLRYLSFNLKILFHEK